MEDEIRRFNRVVFEEMNLPDPEATQDTTPLGAGGLGLDSLQLIGLCARLDEHFGLRISDDLVTVMDLSYAEFVEFAARRAESSPTAR